MKKTIRRTLAILLAALMTLGISTAALAAPLAPPAATLAIVTPPTNTGFVLETGEPDLSGLVVTLTQGAFSKTIAYDEIDWEDWDRNFDLYWTTLRWFEEGDGYEELELKIGPCDLFLYAWYWDAETDEYHNAYTTFTFNVTTVMTPDVLAGAAALTESAFATVNLTRDVPFQVLKFTPSASGWYSFYSKDENSRIDPLAMLYSGEPQVLARDDDGGEDRNFGLKYGLQAGGTYYLLAKSYSGEDVGSYKVGVKAIQPLDTYLKAKNVTFDYHGYVQGIFADDCPWSLWELEFSNPNLFGGDCRGTIFTQRGRNTVTITAPDGSSVKVTITVRYTPEQWLCVVFLGGWAWMQYTEPGPFSLKNEIGNLLWYGISDALYVLFSDWGIPDWLITWLRWL